MYEFKIKVEKKKYVLDCNLISLDIKTFCSLVTVQATCPVTCDSCSVCADSPFKFKKSDIKKCNELENKNDSRCGIANVRAACRKTCDVCQR